MKKNSLQANGLSLSQAQSVSNLCHQRALEIGNKLTNVNNYSKIITVGRKTHNIVVGKPLPDNVVDLLIEKSELHSCQGFLMENIKAKDLMLTQIRCSGPDISFIQMPEKPKYLDALCFPQVSEEFGWEQLSVKEYSEYLEAESYASHIGQFIHKGKTLDVLRSELPGLPEVEWMVIKDGEKSPVEIKKHHKSEELLELHEKLAKLHRGYEQKVNYFKAKVKNLTTAENARIANINAYAETEVEKHNEELRIKVEIDFNSAQAKIKAIKVEFEKERQAKISATAVLRINVDARFQKVVDMFLNQLPESKE